MAVSNFPIVDIESPPEDDERHRAQLAQAINSLRDGKLNAVVEFSLNVAPAETTTVIFRKTAATSWIRLQATNQLTEAELASGSVLIPTTGITNGQFVVQHVQSALTRTYRAMVLS